MLCDLRAEEGEQKQKLQWRALDPFDELVRVKVAILAATNDREELAEEEEG